MEPRSAEILDVQLDGMHPTRRRILELLKLGGPQTAATLSEELAITRMGVRQHLTALERDRLIGYRTESRGMGRSSHVYSLTTRGDELFPRSYRDLAAGLVDALRDLDGDEAVGRLFAARNKRLASLYRARLAETDREGQLDELARIRSEEGYMAEWERTSPGSYRLSENNCAVFGVALRCEETCRAELELFREVLPEATVTRDEHLVKGDRCCSYRIVWSDEKTGR